MHAKDTGNFVVFLRSFMLDPMRALPRSRLSPVAWLALSLGAHGGVVPAALWGSGLHRDTSSAPSLALRAAPAQVGETFEVPVEEVDRGGAPPAEETAPAEVSEVAPATEGAHARASRPSQHATSVSAAEGGGSGSASFGAVGERSAVDIATAFTRGFPQAASADVAWTNAPFGSAGSEDVRLTLDETGALVSVLTGGAPSSALAAGVNRTVALIRARSFVAAGRETHLRVTATVSPDQVHDGLHGDVFAIGGSFDRGEGSGFFALAVGRRIDVKVREVR
jgi:hypothetical protein